ncbi:MAG: hypothetical protein JWM80_5848 [Cyanobacteria bacterium RYN_339]|nr:hypothetical protein [Cyanobacteria bacterium RYN_339]
MTINVGAYRLLGYSNAPDPSLKEVRQDARELKREYRNAPPAPVAPYPVYSLAGLTALFGELVSWLSNLLHLPAAPAVPAGPVVPVAGRPTRFVISSFNILGSNHTVPGADAAEYASGPTRIRWAAQLLEQHHVDVVGFQEMNNDQATAFKQATGNTYGMFPGAAKRSMASNNSIAWRNDTWDLVKAYTVDITSHKGNLWPCPVVRLRNKETGQETIFCNFHNAPGLHLGLQQGNRDKAKDQEVALVNKLKAETGLPVIVTGDMNERETFYQQFHQQAGMNAANAGPGGRLPKNVGIDWIFGSAGVSFKGFTRDRGALERKVSDHGMITSEVKIG